MGRWPYEPVARINRGGGRARGAGPGCVGLRAVEAAPTNMTAMPRRPDVAPPADGDVGVIVGEVRVETLAASVAIT